MDVIIKIVGRLGYFWGCVLFVFVLLMFGIVVGKVNVVRWGSKMNILIIG